MSSGHGGSSQDLSSNGRVVGLLRPYSGRLLGVLGLLVMLVLTDLAPPFAIKLLIDDVFAESARAVSMGGRGRMLGLILLGLFMSYVARNALFYYSRMLALKTSEDVSFSLRKRLFDHLQQLSLRFYRANQPGQVGARVMDDTYKIQSFIQDKFPLLMLNLLKFQILVVVICMMNIRLALAAIIILPLQFVTYRFFRAPIRKSHSEAQENLSIAYGSLVEKFLGMEVVKGFSAEARESATFNRAIDETRKSQIRSQQFHFAQKVTADLLVGLGTIMLIAYGAFEVIKGRMLGGDFMMFFGYVMMLYPSVLEIISGVGHSSKAVSSVNRVFEMLEEPIQEHREIHGSNAVIKGGAIELRGVSFSYDDSAEVLHNISLKITPGERVAITGPSGSGKSTTIKLLPKFVAPTEGTVLIGGVDLSTVPATAVRSSIALAFQEVFLFNASIYENIRYAREGATLEEVREACRLTGADEVIARLPDGYNTRLADFGAEISRGEKQRITLARALLKNAEILILDEATASIDRGSSRAIMDSVFQRMRDRTVLMVTHETHLLDLVDRVVCIRDGRVVFDGTPQAYARYEPAAFLSSAISKDDRILEPTMYTGRPSSRAVHLDPGDEPCPEQDEQTTQESRRHDEN
ncbi:MAG: ABC transporter ATP-binding protein [Phycisphaerales bacterium]|nr:ABC transporter ATP-binding protein [Phycisphaerales bacterium]